MTNHSVLLAIALALLASAAAWSSPSLRYQSIDVPGATDTQAFGINDLGDIVGRYDDADFNTHGWLRHNGKLSTIDFPGAPFTAPRLINNGGEIVGRYIDVNGTSHAFLLRGGHFTSIDFPGAIDTRGRGIDDFGRITGNYRMADGVEHGFLRDAHGVFHTVDVPGSSGTDVWTINDVGVMVGDFTDQSGVVHGYVLKEDEFITQDFPSPLAQDTSTRYISLSGRTAGVWDDAAGNDRGYISTRHGPQTVAIPAAVSTDAMAINVFDVLVGLYTDPDGTNHGFVMFAAD